eukprot:7353835-Pyramimonas_sp.AAC.1
MANGSTSYADHHETSPHPWGIAMGFWEGQRNDAAMANAAQRKAHGAVSCPCRIPSPAAFCL